MLYELINKFRIVLEQKLNDANLQLLYNNLGSLKIKNKNVIYCKMQDFFKTNITTGEYYSEENIISIFPLKNKNNFLGLSVKEYIINLYHELLHMSSTLMDKEQKICYSGFCQDGLQKIGVALNDGYTELLLKRLFNIEDEFLSYDYEIIIAAIIEEFISQNKMTNLYFDADLYGLVLELVDYNTMESILDFIEDFDTLYYLEDYSKKYSNDIIYYHNRISKFIIDTYQNKLKMYLKNNIISKEEYDVKLYDCTNKLHLAFEKLDIKKTKERRR